MIYSEQVNRLINTINAEVHGDMFEVRGELIMRCRFIKRAITMMFQDIFNTVDETIPTCQEVKERCPAIFANEFDNVLKVKAFDQLLKLGSIPVGLDFTIRNRIDEELLGRDVRSLGTILRRLYIATYPHIPFNQGLYYDEEEETRKLREMMEKAEQLTKMIEQGGGLENMMQVLGENTADHSRASSRP